MKTYLVISGIILVWGIFAVIALANGFLSSHPEAIVSIAVPILFSALSLVMIGKLNRDKVVAENNVNSYYNRAYKAEDDCRLLMSVKNDPNTIEDSSIGFIRLITTGEKTYLIFSANSHIWKKEVGLEHGQKLEKAALSGSIHIKNGNFYKPQVNL